MADDVKKNKISGNKAKKKLKATPAARSSVRPFEKFLKKFKMTSKNGSLVPGKRNTRSLLSSL